MASAGTHFDCCCQTLFTDVPLKPVQMDCEGGQIEFSSILTIVLTYKNRVVPFHSV